MTPLVPVGTPIAVVAPSGVFDPERLARGTAIAAERGHVLRPLPDLLRPHRYLASDDAHRLDQLTRALTDPDFGAVWIARGGYGLTRLLDRIRWDDLPPRPVIGFSDVTALFLGLHRHTASPLVHGPVLHSLPTTDAESRDHLFDLLAGKETGPLRGTPWIPGEARGALLGGNLCLLATTCGTRFQLDARGAILVLEEIGEAPYRVDRMLQQLSSAGLLEGVAGVAVGELTGCEAPAEASYTIRDVILEHLAPLGVPVLGDLPIGHGARNRAFPWRAEARLSGDALSWVRRD